MTVIMPPIATNIPVIEALDTNIKLSKSTIVYHHLPFMTYSVIADLDKKPQRSSFFI